MLKEITSVEEMAALPSGAHILNRFRQPKFVRERYNRPDDDWREVVFRLKVTRNGIPRLLGKYGTDSAMKERDFNEDNRYFVEVKE